MATELSARLERLTVLIDWAHANAADLETGMNHARPFVLRFMHAWINAMLSGTDAAIEAAEIALLELDADWESK